MRHRRKGTTTFGRRKDARKALMSSLLIALLKNDRIETTLMRAKEVGRLAEKLITYGKKNTVHTRRQAYKILRDRDLVKKLFDEIAIRYNDRNGGYTRVIKTGFRIGDSAPTAIVEFVEEEVTPKKKKKLKTDKKKVPKKQTTEKKTEKVSEEKTVGKTEMKEEATEIVEEVAEETPEERVEEVQEEEEIPKTVEPEEDAREEDVKQAKEEVEEALKEEPEEKREEVPEKEKDKTKEQVDKE